MHPPTHTHTHSALQHAAHHTRHSHHKGLIAKAAATLLTFSHAHTSKRCIHGTDDPWRMLPQPQPQLLLPQPQLQLLLLLPPPSLCPLLLLLLLALLLPSLCLGNCSNAAAGTAAAVTVLQ